MQRMEIIFTVNRSSRFSRACDFTSGGT